MNMYSTVPYAWCLLSSYFRTVGMLSAWYAWSMHEGEGVPLDWNDNKTHIHKHASRNVARDREKEITHACTRKHHIHASLSSCLFPSLPLPSPLFALVPASLRTGICLRRIANSSTPSPHYTLYIYLSILEMVCARMHWKEARHFWC